MEYVKTSQIIEFAEQNSTDKDYTNVVIYLDWQNRKVNAFNKQNCKILSIMTIKSNTCV